MSLSSAALTQVEITRSFTAKQPDELSLQVADVVLVYQCVSDGEWASSWDRPAHRATELLCVTGALLPSPFGLLTRVYLSPP